MQKVPLDDKTDASKTEAGVDALEKLAYLIAEEFVGESKRRLTRELLEGSENESFSETSAAELKTKKAGGGS